MSETNAAPSEVPYTSGVPEYATAAAHLNAKEQEWNKLEAHSIDLYAQYDESIIQLVEDVSNDYHAKYWAPDVIDSNEPKPSLSEYLSEQGTIPQAVIDTQAAIEKVEREVTAAKEDLEARSSEKAVEVLGIVEALEARIDYDILVSDIRNKTGDFETQYDISFIIGARKLLRAGHVFTYYQLDEIEREVAACTKRWAEDELLITGNAEVVHTPSANETPLAVVPESETELRAFHEWLLDKQLVHIAFRPFDSSFHHTARAIFEASKDYVAILAPQADPMPKDVWTYNTVTYNDQFRQAMKRSIMADIAEFTTADFESDTSTAAYTALVEAARTIDVDEALAKLEISGNLDALPFAITKAEINDFIKATIPPMAFVGSTRVEFRALTFEENPKNNTAGINVYDSQTDETLIVVDVPFLQEEFKIRLDLPELFPKDDPNPVVSTKNTMLRFLAHEFGHSLHRVLPYAALKMWQQAAGSDPTNMSAYVKKGHDTEHAHRYMEDFSDSLSFFVMKPDVLQVISEVRFQALRNIYNTFMPGYEQGLRREQYSKILSLLATQKSGLYSDEQIRQLYLEHEAEPLPVAV